MNEEWLLLGLSAIVVAAAGWFGHAVRARDQELTRAQAQLELMTQRYARLAQEHADVLDRCADYYDGVISTDDLHAFAQTVADHRRASPPAPK